MANTEQEPQHYLITVEVEFGVTATSIGAAYKLFEKWMVDRFNDAFSNGNEHPAIAPCGFEGLAVKRTDYPGVG